MHTKLARIGFMLLTATSISNFLPAQVTVTTAAARQKSLEAKRTMAAATPFTTAFRNVGPTVMSGRVVDIDVNPADPTEFYVAYATGGLWQTTNNGLSFNPIFDTEDVIGLGAVKIHWPSRTIWLGTGEANSSRSSYSGIGMYKSSNTGKTWQYPANHCLQNQAAGRTRKTHG